MNTESVEFVWSLLLQHDTIKLPLKALSNAAAVCGAFRKCLLHILEENATYKIAEGENLKLCRPKKVIIASIDSAPSSATHVTFASHFNSHVDTMPNSITHLVFGYHFNQKVDNLPNSITHLTFGYMFDQEVNQLPRSITHLNFGFYFDQKVSKLPTSVTHLTFAHSFNQHLSSLPRSLLSLTLGRSYNTPLATLPSSLRSLVFHSHFDHPLRGLPSSLTHLTLGFAFNQSIDKLPRSITHLTVNSWFNKPIKSLPAALTHLELNAPLAGYTIAKFPLNLVQLKLRFNGTMPTFLNTSIIALPPTVTHIMLDYWSNPPREMGVFPASLTHLVFGDDVPFIGDRISVQASSLTFLCTPQNFRGAVEALPETLTHLMLYRQFNSEVEKILPKRLTHLMFGDDFNHPIRLYPPTLTHVHFGRYYSQPLIREAVPHTVTHISFFPGYPHLQTYTEDPPSLRSPPPSVYPLTLNSNRFTNLFIANWFPNMQESLVRFFTYLL